MRALKGDAKREMLQYVTECNPLETVITLHLPNGVQVNLKDSPHSTGLELAWSEIQRAIERDLAEPDESRHELSTNVLSPHPATEREREMESIETALRENTQLSLEDQQALRDKHEKLKRQG